MNLDNWILCPICGNKTRLKVREDTVLERFPLIDYFTPRAPYICPNGASDIFE
ncbi:MAG: cysteine-rich KTR domain-containing protein [Lachnospiraceae bacterium]